MPLLLYDDPFQVHNTLEAVHAVQPAVQHCHAMCNAAGALAVHKAAMLNAPMLHAHHPRYAELPEQLDGFHDGDRWMHTPDGKGVIYEWGHHHVIPVKPSLGVQLGEPLHGQTVEAVHGKTIEDPAHGRVAESHAITQTTTMSSDEPPVPEDDAGSAPVESSPEAEHTRTSHIPTSLDADAAGSRHAAVRENAFETAPVTAFSNEDATGDSGAAGEAPTAPAEDAAPKDAAPPAGDAAPKDAAPPAGTSDEQVESEAVAAGRPPVSESCKQKLEALSASGDLKFEREKEKEAWQAACVEALKHFYAVVKGKTVSPGEVADLFKKEEETAKQKAVDKFFETMGLSELAPKGTKVAKVGTAMMAPVAACPTPRVFSWLERRAASRHDFL